MLSNTDWDALQFLRLISLNDVAAGPDGSYWFDRRGGSCEVRRRWADLQCRADRPRLGQPPEIDAEAEPPTGGLPRRPDRPPTSWSARTRRLIRTAFLAGLQEAVRREHRQRPRRHGARRQGRCSVRRGGRQQGQQRKVVDMVTASCGPDGVRCDADGNPGAEQCRRNVGTAV
jgi:hypothetical protein